MISSATSQLSRTTWSWSNWNFRRMSAHSLDPIAPKASAASCRTIRCSDSSSNKHFNADIVTGFSIWPITYAISCRNNRFESFNAFANAYSVKPESAYFLSVQKYELTIADSSVLRLRSENMARYRSNSGFDGSSSIDSREFVETDFSKAGAGSTDKYGLRSRSDSSILASSYAYHMRSESVKVGCYWSTPYWFCIE